jgi:cytochrome c biogenesis protein CcmG, thiol:disulfide interchange protein DsbE
MKRKRKSYWIPIVLLSLLAIAVLVIWKTSKNPTSTPQLELALPAFHLVNLLEPDKSFSSKDMLGEVALINVWASWCYPCRHENPLLIKIARNYHVPIFGLLYKDGSEQAKRWLKKFNNPFVAIGLDSSGMISEELGVYATPATFLIDKNGMIRYRHVGVLTEKVWQQEFWPLVQTFRHE